MSIKGAIFDLDGTLMDSMFIWDTIGADYLISRGIEPEPGLNEIFKNMSLLQAAEYYQDTYGMKEPVEEIMAGVNEMIAHLYSDVVVKKPGIEEVLKQLKQHGVKMCVATATDEHLVKAALRNNGIEQYFKGILTCNNVGAGKDNPLIYEKALQMLQTGKEETIVFEDALYAVQTAKEAKFIVAGVYDKSSEDNWEQIQGICDMAIWTFEEWEAVLI